jgi:transcriptional regulator with XRE-family HTH domain
MEKHGLIIRHLRTLASLSVRDAARKIGRSTGWLSEIENNTGTARLSETEFDRIVDLLDGSKHRAMFKTWASSLKRGALVERTYDGAVLKFIRLRKGLSLREASRLARLSPGYISKMETGLKPVSKEMRNQVMTAYGYSPTSFKNLSTNPVRSKAVPVPFKLEILLHALSDAQTGEVFRFAQALLDETKTAHSQSA